MIYTARTFIFLLVLSSVVYGQSGRKPVAEPSPGQTPTEVGENDTVKIRTEEVRIPLFVTDSQGRNEYFLETDDVMVFEDGVMQEVRSIRRFPAYVALLLDTNGLMNPAMRTSSTRDIALAFVGALKKDDSLAVIQAGKYLEVVQNWTTDTAQAQKALKTKLISGNAARLSDGLARAAQIFAEAPQGNRHLVVVTDGAESPGGKISYADAARRLNELGISVHIISYAALGTDELEQRISGKKILGPPRQTAGDIARQADPSLPGIPRNQTGSVTVDLDRELRRRRQAYIAAMQRGAARLSELAKETGGRLWELDNAAPFTDKGLAVARDIGAQYVVTYRPKRALADARPGEYRKLQVALRRPDVVVRTRRGYVAAPTTASKN
jgi:VWFA-related protein